MTHDAILQRLCQIALEFRLELAKGGKSRAQIENEVRADRFEAAMTVPAVAEYLTASSASC
jgi:hypothetical protein